MWEHQDRSPPTFLHCTQRTAVTPCGPNAAPHSRQCECPSPHAVFLILSRRLERRLRADAKFDSHQRRKKNKSSESVSICVRVLSRRRRRSVSPNPLLLLALHHGCAGQDAVDDLLLLICELLPGGAARHVHRPPSLEEAHACAVLVFIQSQKRSSD